MLLQRLATSATGGKQARYRRGPTRGSEALHAHAQYNTQPVGIEGPWHLLFNAWCNEFRRGFCTLVLSCTPVLCIVCSTLWFGYKSMCLQLVSQARPSRGREGLVTLL